MVEYLETGVEVKKVDSQGRLILPVDWREAEMAKAGSFMLLSGKVT